MDHGRGYTHVDDLEPWALPRDAPDPEGVARFADVVLTPLWAPPGAASRPVGDEPARRH